MTNNTHKRGFASMDKDRLKLVAAKGGASVPASKRTFSDPEKARAARAKQDNKDDEQGA